MAGRIKPIGGEFWFQKLIFNRNVDNFQGVNGTFLSGGQSAIKFIINSMNFTKKEYILMPSYLCPSILHSLKEDKINYEFYTVNRDLSIDIKDIQRKLAALTVKAIFFIDYFGFYHKRQVLDFFNSIKGGNVILIEDAVQLLYFNKKDFIGDYVFNSYRKFLPIDGSLVLSKESKKILYHRDDYDTYMREARIKKTEYINNNSGNEEEYLKLFHLAEQSYYKRKSMLGINPTSKTLLSMINENYISKKRKSNFMYLYKQLYKNSNITFLFSIDDIDNIIPLAMPILIDNRNEVRKKLFKESIFCPVHWNILNEPWSKNYAESRWLSEHILSLPIDERYDENEMNRLIENFEKALK